MDIEEFKQESARTLVDMQEGATLSQTLADTIYSAMVGTEFAGSVMDQIKKFIYYNKPAMEKDLLDSIMERTTSYMGRMQERLENGEVDISADIHLSEHKVQLLHALIGMQTELAEMINPLIQHIFKNQPLDIVNLFEELGDFDWYKAILLRNLHIDEGESRQRVIDKLRVRYPDRFTAQLANERDLEAERAALEGGV